MKKRADIKRIVRNIIFFFACFLLISIVVVLMKFDDITSPYYGEDYEKERKADSIFTGSGDTLLYNKGTEH